MIEEDVLCTSALVPAGRWIQQMDTVDRYSRWTQQMDTSSWYIRWIEQVMTQQTETAGRYPPGDIWATKQWTRGVLLYGVQCHSHVYDSRGDNVFARMTRRMTVLV